MVKEQFRDVSIDELRREHESLMQQLTGSADMPHLTPATAAECKTLEDEWVRMLRRSVDIEDELVRRGDETVRAAPPEHGILARRMFEDIMERGLNP